MTRISTKFVVAIGALGVAYAALCFCDTWVAVKEHADKLVASQGELALEFGRSAGFHDAATPVIGMDVVTVPLPSALQQLAEHGFAQMLSTVLWLTLLLGGILAVFRWIVGRRLADITKHFREATRPDRQTPLEPVAVRGNDEIAELARSFNTLGERERAAQRELEHKVQERTKELNCLYGLSKLVEADGAAVDSIAKGLVEVLVQSWQYPEVACARISIEGSQYTTDNFHETEWKQASPIRVGGHQVGQVEVGYLVEKPQADEGPFLVEERSLLDAIAERLGHVVGRFRAEAAVRTSEEWFKTLFECSSDALMIGTLKEGFYLGNAAAVDLSGCKSQEEFASFSPLDLSPERQPDGRLSCEKLENLLALAAAKGSHLFPWRCVRTDGSEFDAEILVTRMELNGKALLHASVRDVTEEKKREQQFARLNCELVELSRRTGMAEVASGVLHNVGNVLNSVGVAANIAAEKLCADHGPKLCRVADMLDEHAGRLAEFFSTDNKGRQLPHYLRTLGVRLTEENDGLRRELSELLEKIEHIKEIVSMQQTYSHLSGIKETVRLDELFDAALKLNDASFVRHDVEIVRRYDDVPPLSLDKHAVLQVMVNLISNAKQALKDSTRGDNRLTLRIQRAEDDHVCIEVADNGVGIARENLDRVFEYGFTTRRAGHGFGLHSSALAAKELGGRLAVHSDGPGRGARFSLQLPLIIEKEALCPV